MTDEKQIRKEFKIWLSKWNLDKSITKNSMALNFTLMALEKAFRGGFIIGAAKGGCKTGRLGLQPATNLLGKNQDTSPRKSPKELRKLR